MFRNNNRILGHIFLLALFVMSAIIGVRTCEAAEGKNEPYKLRLAYSPELCQAPLHIAVEKGFLEAEGIDAENIQISAALVQEAMGAGQVDAAFGLMAQFLLPIENGLGITFTAGIHTGCLYIMVPQDSDIKSIADLKGKHIALPGMGGASAILLKRALVSEGISIDMKNPEVNMSVFAMTDMPQALENGAVDAIALSDPTASKALKEYGYRVIVDMAATEPYSNEYCCASFVTNDLVRKHPDVAAAFTRAVLKASVWVNEHPEETARIQLEKKYVAGEEKLNASVLKHYNYMPSVRGGYEALQLATQQLVDIGILKANTDVKSFVEKHFVFFDDVPDTYSPEDSKTSL